MSAVENRVEDLRILLQHVQRHKRHTGCCLRVRVGEANSTMPAVAGEQYCRLGFPKAQCPATRGTVRHRGGINVSMEVNPERHDPLVNSYNPPLLQLWRTNTNVSALLLTDVAKYIAKYVSEEETPSSAYGDFVRRLVEHELPDLASMKTVIATSALRNSARLFLGRRCTQCPVLSCCSLFLACVASSSALVTALPSTLNDTCGDPTRFPICPFSPSLAFTRCVAPAGLSRFSRLAGVTQLSTWFLSFRPRVTARVSKNTAFNVWSFTNLFVPEVTFWKFTLTPFRPPALFLVIIELANEVPVAGSNRVVLPVSDPFDTGPLVAPPASVSFAPEPTPDNHDRAAACQHLHVIAPDADQFIRFCRENTSLPARSSSTDSALLNDEQRAVFDTVIAHHSGGRPSLCGC